MARALRSRRVPPLIVHLAVAAALIGAPACGDDDECEEGVASWCGGYWQRRQLTVEIGDGVALDVDGDGVLEYALLDRENNTLTLAWPESRRDELYRLDGHTLQLAKVDLDGDGVLDLAVTCDGPPRLQPLYVRDGALELGAVIPLDETPLSVAVGELDGDARPELLIGHSSGITVLHGVDQRLQVSAWSGAPVAMELADFDADGAVDVAAIDLDGASLGILRGDGSGGLSPMTSIPLGPAPEDVDVADVNGDGAVDAVVRSRLGHVWIVEGDGAGGFSPPWELERAGDLSAGRGVLAIPAEDSGLFAVITPAALLRVTVSDPMQAVLGLASQSGWFTARVLREELVAGDRYVAPLTSRPGPSLLSVATLDLGPLRGLKTAGDIDGDGVAELIGLSSECEVMIFREGPEGLDAGELTPIDYDGDCPSALDLVDLNGDGELDLLATHYIPKHHWIQLALGGPGDDFELLPQLPLEELGYEAPLVAARPGGSALLSNIRDTDDRWLVLNVDAEGNVSEGEEVLPPGRWEVAAGDVDGDGQGDLVVFTGTLGQMPVVYRGEGGSFVEGPAYDSVDPFLWDLSLIDLRLMLGDLDGDGRDEAVLYSSGEIATVTDLDTVPALVDPHTVDRGLHNFGARYSLGDLDGDGIHDLITSDRQSIISLRGLPGHRFAAASDRLDLGEFSWLVPADLDDDGRLDIFAGGYEEQVRIESRNIGIPALGEMVEVGAPEHTSLHPPTAYGDFNGDGKLDVVLAYEGLFAASWGDDGSFSRATFAPTPAPRDEFWTLGAADFDGDGRDELIAYDTGIIASSVHVFRWDDGAWTSAYRGWIGDPYAFAGVTASDLDGDGTLDLAIAQLRDDEPLALYISYGIGAGAEDGSLEFEEPIRTPTPTTTAELQPYFSGIVITLESADLDGDGRPELLTDGPGPGRTHLLWNDGARRWTHAELPAGSARIAGVGELITADLDRIGRIPVYGRRLGDPVRVADGLDLGDYVTIDSLPECDGDGRRDLSLYINFEGTVTRVVELWRGVSESFVRVVQFQGRSIRCADLNGDGEVELLSPSGFGLLTRRQGGPL